MKARVLLLGSLITAILSTSTVWSGIPEPDAVLFGSVFLDGVVQTALDADVSIVARVDGVPNPVGSYKMGANQDAGDSFVLRIRLESLVDGDAQSNDTALIGQTVHIMIQKGQSPERMARDYVIPERGNVQMLTLDTRALGDWNGDTRINLSDFPDFTSCMNGPIPEAIPVCQAVFDFEVDSRVDLRDFARFQTAFTGDE